MSIFDFLFRKHNPLEEQGVKITPELIASVLQGIVGKNGGIVNPEGAMTHSVVFACVRVIADGIASLAPQIFSDDENGKILAADHRIADLLNNPCDALTGTALHDKIVSECLLHGNSYVAIIRDGAGRAAQLLPLPPASITVTIDPETNEKIYRLSKIGIVPASELLHFYFFSLDGLVGVSLLHYAAHSTEYGLNLQNYGSNLIAKGGSHTGILNSAAKLSPEQIDALKKVWQEYQGSQGAGSTPILHGITWQGTSMPADEMQFLESRKYNAVEICRFFQVPPHLVWELSNNNYNIAEENTLEFFRFCIRPKLIKIQQEIQRKLLTDPYCIEYDFSVLTKGDTAARTQYVNAGVQGGWLLINEARAEFNLPPIDGGDALRTPLNLGNAGGNPETSKTVEDNTNVK